VINHIGLGVIRDTYSNSKPVVHTYHLRAKGLPTTVTFTSAVPGLPLPDPRYLALHAACAQVAHIPGAGGYVGTVFRKTEDVKCLASNGLSAQALEYALLKSSREPSGIYSSSERPQEMLKNVHRFTCLT